MKTRFEVFKADKFELVNFEYHNYYPIPNKDILLTLFGYRFLFEIFDDKFWKRIFKKEIR